MGFFWVTVNSLGVHFQDVISVRVISFGNHIQGCYFSWSYVPSYSFPGMVIELEFFPLGSNSISRILFELSYFPWCSFLGMVFDLELFSLVAMMKGKLVGFTLLLTKFKYVVQASLITISF